MRLKKRAFAFLLLALLSTSFAGAFDNLAPGSWQNVSQFNLPSIRPALMGWEFIKFASAINCGVVAGEYWGFSTECQNALLAYSPARNQWELLDVGPKHSGATKSDFICISGHDFGKAEYDESSHAFVVYGTDAMGNAHYGPLQYDVRGNIGRLYYGGLGPVNRYYVGSAYDPDSSCIYFVGGVDASAAYSTAFCWYRPATNTYKVLPNIPELIQGQCNAYFDRAAKKLVLLGLAEPYNVWLYDPAANTWQKAAHSHPLGGYMYKNPIYNEVLGKGVFFEYGTSTLWTYTASTDTWQA
jgi:hypothetical protein